MKIKTGDNVKILSGRDRGKTGKVLQMIFHPKKGEWYAVVEGCNVRKKHLRVRGKKEKGQIIELSAPLPVSKVMLIDPKTNRPTRVGYTIEGGVKKRVAKKSGEFIA